MYALIEKGGNLFLRQNVELNASTFLFSEKLILLSIWRKWMHIRCSEDLHDVFWTSHVRSIYILRPGKLALSKHVETYISEWNKKSFKKLNFGTAHEKLSTGYKAYFFTENVCLY